MGIHLDEQLTFKHHINEMINKANKGTGIIRKLNNIPPCSGLLTTYVLLGSPISTIEL